MADDGISLSDDGKGAKAYGEAVGVYLSFAVDKLTNLSSTLVSWMNDRGALRETFGRQAVPMVWDYAETNPFSSSGGSIAMFVDRIKDVLRYLPEKSISGITRQFDAQSDSELRNIMVSTDPPYYDNIGYADLSDYFYVWMRQSLKKSFPKLFRTMLVPKAEELVATQYRFDGSKQKAKVFFENGMFHACQQIFLYAREDIPVTVYYAYKQSDTDKDSTALHQPGFILSVHGCKILSTVWGTL